MIIVTDNNSSGAFEGEKSASIVIEI